MPVFVILILWPFAEIALFATIGDEIGFINAILLCIAAAVAGSFLIQSQGMRAWQQIQDALNRGDLPVADIFNGICLYLAGILLMLPGFLSDFIAIALLFPPTRRGVRRVLERFFVGAPVHFNARPTWTEDAGVIDGEFTHVNEGTGGDGEFGPDVTPDDPKRLS